MPLALNLLSGRFAGKQLAFDEKFTPRVRVGRAIDAEVSWPEEETIVGSNHFELCYEAGVWKFVLSPHHRVYVPGGEAYDGMPLEDEAVVHLGDRNGPSLSLKHVKSGTNQAKTLPQGTAIDDRGLIKRAQEHIVLVVASVAILAAVTGYFVNDLLSSVRELRNVVAIARVSVEQQAARQRLVEQHMNEIAEKTDLREVFARSNPAIFYVDLVGPGHTTWGGATAWVVKLKDGRKAFATNAHVAEKYETDVEGNTERRMVARSPIPPGYLEYNIVDAVKHPGYVEFNERTRELERQVSLGKLRDVGFALGYDVALLTPESQKGLPEPLPLASDDEIAHLRAGEVLASAGYPNERSITMNGMTPDPIRRKGMLAKTASFFLMPSSDPQLILHDLPATGGASGSPIFNTAGHVVALLNSGNVTTSGDGYRTPSAVLVNFGQRVDLLRELIEGTAEARMPAYRQAWAETEFKIRRGPREFVDAEIAFFKAEHGGAERAGAASGTIDAASPAYKGHPATSLDLDIEAGHRYRAFAISEDKGAKLSLLLLDSASAGYLDMIESDASVAELEFDALKTQKGRLVVVSAAKEKDGKPSLTPVKFEFVVWRVKN